MGGAGSSNKQILSADNAKSIDISTETQNIGAKYTIFDFEGGKGEITLAVFAVLLVFAITGLIYIKRRFIKRKLQHQRELERLKGRKKVDEEMPVQQSKPKQEFEMAIYNPKLAQKQLDEMKSVNSQFGSRVQLLEARVFQGEI